MHQKLLSPAKIGHWDLANRVVMPPLTRSRAQPDWSPSPDAPEYYRQRNTAGLVICEATQVSPDATGYARTPGIWTDLHIAGWRQIVEGIHAGGAKAVLQLWHCGRIAHPDNQPEGCSPMGPSAVQPGLPIYTDVAGGMVENPVPREMTEADIQGVIAAHEQACRNAKLAGFDGVELHAANGYLVEQFTATNTNVRNDAWGGTVAKRMRFMAEVLAAMKRAYPADCIGVRLSPFGTFNDIRDADPQATYEAMLEVAQAAKVGYVHIIRPVVSGNIEMEASARDHEVIATARKHFGGTLIGAAGYTPDSAEAALQQNEVDLVAFGRAYVGNPDLVERIRKGIPFAQNDQATLYTPGAKGYTDYPTAG